MLILGKRGEMPFPLAHFMAGDRKAEGGHNPVGSANVGPEQGRNLIRQSGSKNNHLVIAGCLLHAKVVKHRGECLTHLHDHLEPWSQSSGQILRVTTCRR
jgi:hypothetical protein